MLIATGTAQGSQRWVRLGLRHTVSTLEGKVVSRGAADRGSVSSVGARGAHHLLVFYQFLHLKLVAERGDTTGPAHVGSVSRD